jgi:3-deoxy-D-manno-octulosonic-acid transferase
MKWIYKAGIFLYWIAIKIAAFKSTKAQNWVKGRAKQLHIFDSVEYKNDDWIWFHCASLGEFEQGRPVMEELRKKVPHYKILLTFFSPSGFEVRKTYPGADLVLYLPLDTESNVEKFLHAFQPKLSVFVKYEFWFGYLEALRQKNIPTFLISARFRPDQIFFQFYGSWFRKHLDCFTEIHVQDEDSAKLLKSIGYSRFIISGDSRYDRVYSNAQNPQSLPLIENWLQGRKVLIGGSTWPEDDSVIFPWHSEYWALIVAPHEISEHRIQAIESSCGTTSVRYSELVKEPKQSHVLIIDNVGMLLSVYALGNLAYVGGAFGKGLHNILEPAACGLPVIFGPKHAKFIEASELIKHQGAISISTIEQFQSTFIEFGDAKINEEKKDLCSQFVKDRIGATEMIMKSIMPYIKNL